MASKKQHYFSLGILEVFWTLFGAQLHPAERLAKEGEAGCVTRDGVKLSFVNSEFEELIYAILFEQKRDKYFPVRLSFSSLKKHFVANRFAPILRYCSLLAMDGVEETTLFQFGHPRGLLDALWSSAPPGRTTRQGGRGWVRYQGWGKTEFC